MKKVEIKKSKVSDLGLFACEVIPWGEEIIEYIGEKITKREASRRGRFYSSINTSYLFELNDKYDLDGLVGGNESRFINHSKNKFNCVPIRRDGKIFFHAYDEIKKGEELLFDYGEGFWE